MEIICMECICFQDAQELNSIHEACFVAVFAKTVIQSYKRKLVTDTRVYT